ncbi:MULTISPECIES: nucleoside-diphosphate kinase [unclassified Gordonia (in: high G+C Gram-positive bacteria)]
MNAPVPSPAREMVGTPRPTVDLLAALGVPAAHHAELLGDTYVLEAIEHLDRAGVDPRWFATGCSLLLIKPDAIVARAVQPSLDWLADRGWLVRHAARVPADRHLARALWARSWATASPERRRLADLLVGICDAMVLVVEEPTQPGTESATERLTREKGPTKPSARMPGELRYLLGRHTYLLNLVHTPDTPIDVLREWAIISDEAARQRCLADLIRPPDVSDAADESDGAAAALSLAHELYRQVPAWGFERDAALARIRHDLAGTGIGTGCASGDDAACAALLRAAWASGTPMDPWSVIVLGSHVLPMIGDPQVRAASSAPIAPTTFSTTRRAR